MGANCAHESDLNNDNEKHNDGERNPDENHDDVEYMIMLRGTSKVDVFGCHTCSK